MIAIIFSLIAFFAWGIGDVLGIYSARRLNAYSATFWGLVISILFSSFYIPYALPQIYNLSLDIFLLNVFLGSILIVGIFTFNEGLRTSNPSLVGTIASSFVMVTIILALIFFKENISLYQSIAIIFILSGIVFSILDFKCLKTNIFNDKGVIFALISMITWGIYFTFIRIPIDAIGWFWPNYITFSLFPFLLLFIKIRKIELHRPNYKNALPYLISGIILIRIAEFSFNFAISKGLTSIVAPIAGSYPILFVVLSAYLFREPLKKHQIMGIILALTGIVILSIISV